VLLQLGSSVPLQAFSQLTLQLRRVFTNLNVHTTLSSPKESPACPPQHPSTYGLLPHRFGCRRNFLSSFNRCVVRLHLELSRQAHHALNPLIHHDIARRHQGINNYTYWANSAWLKSNSSIWSNRMNDSCFNMSFWIRNMLNVMSSRTYCIWGTPMDCLRAAIKSKASNPAHAILSRSFRQYLDHGRSNNRYINTPGEPHIGNYLVRRPHGNVHRFPLLLDTQRRADIAMVNLHDNITTLVDVTIASHNAQTATTDYTVRCSTAARTIDKRRAYDRETTNPNVNLVIFAVLPPQPYITGILPIVPPPAWLALDVHPRRFAVMPFPERPPHTPEPIAYQIPWIPPITYQPSQVNITNDHQSYGVVEEIPNPSDQSPSPEP